MVVESLPHTVLRSQRLLRQQHLRRQHQHNVLCSSLLNQKLWRSLKLLSLRNGVNFGGSSTTKCRFSHLLRGAGALQLQLREVQMELELGLELELELQQV